VKTGDQEVPTSIYLAALNGEGRQSSQRLPPVRGLLFCLSSGSHVCSYPEYQRCSRQAAYKFAAASPRVCRQPAHCRIGQWKTRYRL